MPRKKSKFPGPPPMNPEMKRRFRRFIKKESMTKIKIHHIGEETDSWHQIQYHYMCQGCGCIHAVSPDKHQFNGDFEKPTFSPSLLQDWDLDRKCHSYIRNGQIQYLSDCFHSLAGQTIELPDIN